jgi:protein SCO1/2
VTPSFFERAGRLVARAVARPAFWIVALGLAFVVPLGRAIALGRNAPHGPALSMPLPAFVLTNERGEPYGSADLKGRVWVADFVFTSCPTACPKLTATMAKIQHRGRNLGDAFHLVTFTVDPDNDTPERLAAYALRYHASPARWSFLTGKLGDLETTVVKGFKIAMGKEESSPGSNIFSIFHGERLVLVDQAGNIRGYYEATDEGVDALMHDVGLVVNGR